MKEKSVVSDPQRRHGLQPTRLLHPRDFPGKSTGVGCHCLDYGDPGSTRYAGVLVVIVTGDMALLEFSPSLWQLCPSEN